MFKLIRGTTALVTGIAASIIFGRLLKKRDEQANENENNSSPIATKLPVDIEKEATVETKVESETQNIELPASAFDNVEEEVTENIVLNQEEAETKAKESKAEEKPAEKKAKPAPATAKKASEPDDLSVINGIGGKTVETLNEMGITTFAQLAAADAATVKETIGRVSVDRVKDWQKEAKKLADA